jgi:hypothetical protein
VVPEETAFVFVTCRRWPNKPQSKDAWAAARTAEGPWRKVIVLDGDNIETWLERCPAVASWFARELGKQPEGVEALESFWLRVVTDTKPELTPEIVLAGREAMSEAIESWAEDKEPILRLKADTREEAVLLVAAWAHSRGEAAQELLLANAVVVHGEEPWRQITGGDRPLVHGLYS